MDRHRYEIDIFLESGALLWIHILASLHRCTWKGSRIRATERLWTAKSIASDLIKE